MSIKMDFESGVVKGFIGVLPEKMADFAFEVLMKEAELIRDLAQVYAPVDTGSLRDSIRVERGGLRLHWRAVRVRAGGYVVNPKTNKLVNYAAIQEIRQPYMRPAFESVYPAIGGLIEQTVYSQLNDLFLSASFERGLTVIQGQVFQI